MQPIELLNCEYELIRKHYKRIGSGVDGTVYKANSNLVYKLYHKNDEFISLSDVQKDEDGVIINDFKELRPFNHISYEENIYYKDKDGVILTREDAIKRAIDKQENVKLTELPKSIIYLNDRIVGCVYTYYHQRFGIYASAYLPMKKRLIVCKRLLEKVKELLDNYIYPVTLAQRDEVFPFIRNKSNILIGRDLDPKLIDLDGISALYSENYSEKYYKRTLISLSALILELLTRVDLANNIIDDENVIEEYIKDMNDAGISLNLCQKYFDNCQLDLGELDDIIKTLELTKK